MEAFVKSYPDYKLNEIDENLILALEQKIEKVRKRIEKEIRSIVIFP